MPTTDGKPFAAQRLSEPAPCRTDVPRLVVAGVSSGVGKTTFVVGLVRALRARGLKVAVFKCGPDYLDPTYHARAAERPSHNLDGWLMGRDAVVGTFLRAAKDSDIAIIEGVMGLFDGASATADEGSTAEIAKWLRAPVMLVIDASGMARSVAAIARGFASFDSEVRLAGLICNRVGSRSHLELLRKAACQPPVLGGLPKNPSGSFPERHLGLRTADEHCAPEALLCSWGEMVGQWCDLDAILALARSAGTVTAQPPLFPAPAAERKCTIGIAFDEAFHFYYEDNLARLASAGAELVRFSPIHDHRLPPVDGIYIGGGYPEVYARELADNSSMRRDIAAFAAARGAIYAECGGMMYLCSELRTLDGAVYPMCGVLPARTRICERLQALGYVEAETVRESILGGAALRFRGHEFRYSTVETAGPVEPAFIVKRRRDARVEAQGFQVRNTIASYVHAHWASNPAIADSLVIKCRATG